MKNTVYFPIANLMLEILPYLSEEKDFVLKGGTAINYFYTDLPRLSIDIDLTFLPVMERTASLTRISEGLERISTRISRIPGVRIFHKIANHTTTKLVVNKDGLAIKIEPNLIIRGSVYPPQTRKLVKKAQTLFEQDISFYCLSLADLYGGKICAALDRQHPRDLFDIHILLKNEGITEEIRKAFLVYLISHPRPIIELLNPTLKDFSDVFENEFKGMTFTQIKYNDLIEARFELIHFVKHSLTERERQFLLSVKQVKPQWKLLELQHIKDLPAVQWKLLNLKKMDKAKHLKAVEKIRTFLEL